ncbi:MAG: putative metal-binding motif-containing protein [Deltaproteobacteria bacterium]|nr:putative metal-binding motif-containing protein [Deltaproteobacteria bacterium]
MARCLILTPFLALVLAGCPDATSVADQCVAADLVGQCPVGSNPVLGAQAEASCGGSFELKVVTESGAATGQCSSNGSCEFLCQYTTPCSCGVATLSRDQIVCAECQDQSCGDGRCEGTERPTCEPGQAGCFPCLEDCGGATCGDGDCTGSESPESCPQDCQDVCIPSSKVCIGTILQVCSADGRTKDQFDCANASLICGQGACVAPGVCGNKACEDNEDPQSCAQDCGSVCVPSSVECRGNDLATCNANGTEVTLVDCTLDGLVCARGDCVAPNVCGNHRCEDGEAETCTQDCAATCNNQICENGEENSCPQDCTECGDKLCGAGELVDCPQDCGICLPSERLCLGKLLRVCNANGTDYEDVDCTAFDQACVQGDCVEPGVCGNGACEQGETLASCADDCTTVCGDGDCEGAETFTTCSLDCEPQCSDGSCQGDETHAGCPQDCLATCGNGNCDGGEDRDNCPKDCGYCGNGTCEDAAESASLFPAHPLVTCLEDCVTSGCDEAADCDDGIFCTAGACDDDVCHYTASDALCPPKHKCIKFSGCCPDADEDGFADAACGGSDCDDSDPLVWPGAVEPCGGGDRNCNGFHRPQLKPAKKVTNTVSYKTGLAMVWDGARFWAAWRGVPEAAARLELARVSKAADLVGGIVTAPDATPSTSRIRMAWSPQSSRLGLAWEYVDLDGGSKAAFTTVSEDGVFPEDPVAVLVSPKPGNNYAHTPPTLTSMAWLDGVWIIADAAWYNNGAAGFMGPYGWWAATELGDVTRRFAGDCYTQGMCPGGARPLVSNGDQIVGLQGTTLYKVVPSDTTGAITKVAIVPPAAAGTCTMGWDGETMALVCLHQGALTYHRLAPNGAALASETIRDTQLAPAAIAFAPGGLGAGDTTKSGVLGIEGTNLVFVMRDLDGSAVVEPGAVAGGIAIADPHLFWDGDVFQAWWLAKSGDIEQLFRTTITCE